MSNFFDLVPKWVLLAFLLIPLAIVAQVFGSAQFFDAVLVIKVIIIGCVVLVVLLVAGIYLPTVFGAVDSELADKKDEKGEFVTPGASHYARVWHHHHTKTAAFVSLVLAIAALVVLFNYDSAARFWHNWHILPGSSSSSVSPVQSAPADAKARTTPQSSLSAQRSAASKPAQKPEGKGWFTGWNPFGFLTKDYSDEMPCPYNPKKCKQEPDPSGSSAEPPSSPPPESPVERRWEMRDSELQGLRATQIRSTAAGSTPSATGSQPVTYEKVPCGHMDGVVRLADGRTFRGPAPIMCIEYDHLDGSAQMLPILNTWPYQYVFGMHLPAWGPPYWREACVGLVYSSAYYAPVVKVCNTDAPGPPVLFRLHIWAIRIPQGYPNLDNVVVTVCPQGSPMGEPQLEGYCGPVIPGYDPRYDPNA